MATATINHANNDGSIEQMRPFANFPPSAWGDRFLSFDLDNSELKAYEEAIKDSKENLRILIEDQTMDSNEKLSLIYRVCRLGLKYLFAEEIDSQLEKLFSEFNLKDYDNVDLYTTSVNFQVFRENGYRLSCDVFNKFKDFSSNKFKDCITNDVKGLLSFYESTQLRIRGESILDEAFTFTQAKLKSVVDTLQGNVAQQVKHALKTPFYRGMLIVEARSYFYNYEEESSTYEALFVLAKAHFNYLQLLQKEELRILTKWYKDMKFQVISPYARDRLPELYVWILAFFLEPHYSQARIITTKVIQLVLVLDDTCDAYATIEEIRILIDAIKRWEISAVEQLPEYIKPFYKILLNEYCEFDKEASKEGRSYLANASKQAFQEIAGGYLKEAEWSHNGRMPSFQEYLENGLITSGYNLLLKSCLMGMGEIVSEETLAWYETEPKILQATKLIGRLQNDVKSFKFEGERAEHVVTGVDAYMKTFGVSQNVAIDKLNEMLDNAWKDINEGCLKPTEVSIEVIAPILNLARMTDVVYRDIDELTFPIKTFKEYITLLFVAFIPK